MKTMRKGGGRWRVGLAWGRGVGLVSGAQRLVSAEYEGGETWVLF